MESSDPAWLAKDPAAQKHLGKYKKDAQGLIWFVDRIDTSAKGDVAGLRQIGQSKRRRKVSVAMLEKLYTDEKVADVDLSTPVAAEDAGELARLPTFFVDANPGDERPVGVVAILGDKRVRVKTVLLKDPRDLSKGIPAIELRPLQEPGKEGEPLPAVTAGPLAVLAFRNPRAIATFMRALDHVDKKLTGETPKFEVQFEKPPRYPRVDVPTEEGWYWRQHRLWEVIRFGDGPLLFMQAGITRDVSVASGPWFGPVPPPEEWK